MKIAQGETLGKRPTQKYPPQRGEVNLLLQIEVSESKPGFIEVPGVSGSPTSDFYSLG